MLSVSVKNSVAESFANGLLGNVLAHDGSRRLAGALRGEMRAHDGILIGSDAIDMSMREKHGVHFSTIKRMQ